MPGITKGNRYTVIQVHRLVIFRKISKIPKRIQCIKRSVQRFRHFQSLPLFDPFPVSSVLFLYLRGVEHDDTRNVIGRGSTDNFPPEALFYQNGNSPAVIQMSVSKEEIVNRGRGKPEIIPVSLFNLKPALKESAVNEDIQTARLEQMT